MSIETLEDRRLLSGVTLAVNTYADTHAAHPSASDLDSSGNVSLRSAIEYLNATRQASDSIMLPGPGGEIDLAFGQIEIAESVAIVGPGAGLLAINGGFGTSADGGPAVPHDSRIFQIDAADSTGHSVAAAMSGLTLEGGHAESLTSIPDLDGGAIYNSGALTLDAMLLTQNSARRNGGAIYNAAGAGLTITDSTLSSNSAPYGGGLDNDGTASIVDSTFSNNTATAGGGIDSAGTLTTLADTFSANNTSFPPNPTPPDGGFTLYNSGGWGEGGGIDNPAGLLTVTDCTFFGNSADNGGGIAANAGPTVTDSTISGNTATLGGGLYDGDAFSSAPTVHLANSIVAGNTLNTPNGKDPDVGGYGAATTTDHDLVGVLGDAKGFTDATGAALNGNLVGTAAVPLKPLLGSLSDHGGPTETMALLPGSPAIAAGDVDPPAPFIQPATDQRGAARIIGGATDIGAYEVDPPASAAAGSGNGQEATVGSTFGKTLTVLVTDQYGNPVPGVTVTFAAPSSGASATFSAAATVVTGGDGEASETVSANTIAGSYNVTAAVDGFSTPISFALTNAPGPAVKITAESGNGQTTADVTPFSEPLTVLVTDKYGNPVPGVMVTFTPPDSGPTALFQNAGQYVRVVSATATTGDDGTASEQVKAIGGVGTYDVTASASGVSTPASFSLTNAPGPAVNIQILSGDQQSAAVGAAFDNSLSVRVTDQYGNPVPGVTVTFAAPPSGASATFPAAATVITGNDGTASEAVTANTVAGAYDVIASADGISTPASFALTNDAGPAANVVAEAGDGQTTPVNTPFSSPLTVLVTDQYGNAVSGATVTFAAPDNGAGAAFPPTGGPPAMTGADGIFSEPVMANTIAGTYDVTASVSGVSPVSFSLTNVPGPAANAVAESGDGQTTTVDTPFGNPLTVLVTDQYGNAVPGVTVAFIAPDSGASAIFANGASFITSGTGNDGTASEAVTANGIVGSYEAAALVPGTGSPVSFSLTNSPVPTRTAIESDLADGSIHGQSVTFTATVSGNVDAAGIPAGIVTFYDGDVPLDTELLDSAGVASYTTADLAAGDHSITASYMPVPNGVFSGSTSSSLDQQVAAFGAATQLVFTVPPTASTAGQIINAVAGVQISVEDQYGNVVTNDDSELAVALAAEPVGGGFVSGVTTGALAVGGVATFSNLAVNLSGDYSLGASDGSLTATASSFVVAPNTGLLLLDSTGSGALSVGGNAALTLNNYGAIVADSTSSTAVEVSGNGAIRASELDISGGLDTRHSVNGVVRTATAATSDPLAELPVPPMTSAATFSAGTYSGLLQPGTYLGGISVSGNSSVALAPGIYYLEGGGLSLSGNAQLAGEGVLIYNAPGGDGRVGAIRIGGNAVATLTPAGSGDYQGIVLLQDRISAAPISIDGNATLKLSGIVYAPAATLEISGNGRIGDAANAPAPGCELIVRDVAMSGNARLSLDADANARTSAAAAMPATTTMAASGSAVGIARASSASETLAAFDQAIGMFAYPLLDDDAIGALACRS